MAGIYVERWSNAAIWCQRFAFFLVPYFVVTIGLYRLAKVETTQLFALLGVGLVLALIGAIMGVRAVIDLWSRGERGGSDVVRGMLAIVLILTPFGYAAYLALAFPLANDVSTDAFEPPLYLTADSIRDGIVELGANPVGDYDGEYARRIINAYPRLQPRRYPAGAERVLIAIQSILEENEWPVTGSQGIPESTGSIEEALEDNKNALQPHGDKAGVEEQIEIPDDIFVEFLHHTPVLGLEIDVVVRIISENENTLVDVRASSRWGSHDLGYNAKLIDRFLSQLDVALLGIAGEG